MPRAPWTPRGPAASTPSAGSARSLAEPLPRRLPPRRPPRQGRFFEREQLAQPPPQRFLVERRLHLAVDRQGDPAALLGDDEHHRVGLLGQSQPRAMPRSEFAAGLG